MNKRRLARIRQLLGIRRGVMKITAQFEVREFGDPLHLLDELQAELVRQLDEKRATVRAEIGAKER